MNHERDRDQRPELTVDDVVQLVRGDFEKWHEADGAIDQRRQEADAFC